MSEVNLHQGKDRRRKNDRVAVELEQLKAELNKDQGKQIDPYELIVVAEESNESVDEPVDTIEVDPHLRVDSLDE